MAAHVYWRINVTAAGGSVVSICALEMYDVSGASLASGGTPSASSVNGGFVAANAFDGDNATFWASGAAPSVGVPEWLRYQFAVAVDVAVMRIIPRNLSSQRPQTFKMQYSDNGTTWTDASVAINTPANWDGPPFYHALSFAVSPAAGTYPNWRVKITAGSTVPTAAEIQMRASSGGADLTSAVNATQYAFADETPGSALTPELAFDDNTGTIFTTHAQALPRYVGYALNRSAAITELMWQAPNNATFNQCPTAFTMQGSYDGVTWTDAWSCTFSAWTVAAQIQICGAPVTQQPMVTIA